ncbi:MAG: TIGR03618 family F420-dependent PPOX class oxidoreductase [Actinomycetota bacterium]
MRRDLRPEDLGDLLDLPLLAVLATRSAEGEVLLSPVWHEWSDGGFTVFTGEDDVKVRHLRRDPRASIVVCEQEPPYRGIEVRTQVRLLRNADTGTGRRIAARYIGEEEAEGWSNPDDVLIRLEPGSLRVWDFVDEYPAS